MLEVSRPFGMDGSRTEQKNVGCATSWRGRKGFIHNTPIWQFVPSRLPQPVKKPRCLDESTQEVEIVVGPGSDAPHIPEEAVRSVLGVVARNTAAARYREPGDRAAEILRLVVYEHDVLDVELAQVRGDVCAWLPLRAQLWEPLLRMRSHMTKNIRLLLRLQVRRRAETLPPTVGFLIHSTPRPRVPQGAEVGVEIGPLQNLHETMNPALMVGHNRERPSLAQIGQESRKRR